MHRQRHAVALLLLLVLALLPEAASRSALAAPPPTSGFFFARTPTANARYAELGDAFVKDGRISVFLASLSAWIAMPRAIPVRLQECGQVNAFYDPARHEIQLCYEFFDYLSTALTKNMAGPNNLPVSSVQMDIVSAHVNSAMLFFAMHEVGHCLVDEFGLGFPGKEEDVVDEFATFLMLGMKQDVNARLGALALEIALPTVQLTQFNDEHEFSEQRSVDIKCVLYGADPAANAGMVTTVVAQSAAGGLTWNLATFLTPTRAQRCVREHKHKLKFWSEKLAPITRKVSP
jgi:hypothetical protein